MGEPEAGGYRRLVPADGEQHVVPVERRGGVVDHQPERGTTAGDDERDP